MHPANATIAHDGKRGNITKVIRCIGQEMCHALNPTVKSASSKAWTARALAGTGRKSSRLRIGCCLQCKAFLRTGRRIRTNCGQIALEDRDQIFSCRSRPITAALITQLSWPPLDADAESDKPSRVFRLPGQKRGLATRLCWWYAAARDDAFPLALDNSSVCSNPNCRIPQSRRLRTTECPCHYAGWRGLAC